MNLDSKINQNIFFKSKLDQKGQCHLITLLLPSCWPMSESATLVAGRSVQHLIQPPYAHHIGSKLPPTATL